MDCAINAGQRQNHRNSDCGDRCSGYADDGTLLISSLIVFPSLTAMRVTRKFRTTVILSAFLAVFCFLAGLVFSYLHAVPTGSCIVVANMILFILFSIVEKEKEGRWFS